MAEFIINNDDISESKKLRHLFLSNIIKEKLSLIEHNIAKSIDQLMQVTSGNLIIYEKSLNTLQKLTKISQDYLKLNETKIFSEDITKLYDYHKFIEKTTLISESLKNLKQLSNNLCVAPTSSLEEINKNLVNVFDSSNIYYDEENKIYKDTVQRLDNIVTKVNHFNSFLGPSVENINAICIDVLKERSDKITIDTSEKNNTICEE